MINIQKGREDWFNRLIEKRIPCGCVCVAQADGAIAVDAGVNCPGGWRAGRYLLNMLIADLGEVVLESMTIGAQTLPMIALYLDHPAAVFRHYLHGEEDYSYQRAQAMPVGSLTKNSVIAAHNSLVDYIYTAGKALPLLIEFAYNNGLDPECMHWGYGRTPILYKGRTEEETERDKDVMRACGSIAGLWVKSEDDRLRKICRAWNGLGQIRLHNILSGNTFVAGSVDEDQLLAHLRQAD
ncbi:MAG: methenyltetrahydromethanopterin cyclohydrolase [Bacillota bacterium]